MGIDHKTCSGCGNIFPDVISFSHCSCGKVFCDTCEDDQIKKYGRHESSGELNECDECNSALLREREVAELERLKAKYDTTSESAMPFTGHGKEHLQDVLDSISNCQAPAEVFDAFLSDYAKTGNLDQARHFAHSEWDC